jgi:hypothetical protein
LNADIAFSAGRPETVTNAANVALAHQSGQLQYSEAAVVTRRSRPEAGVGNRNSCAQLRTFAFGAIGISV